jgi:hypothetical protein
MRTWWRRRDEKARRGAQSRSSCRPTNELPRDVESRRSVDKTQPFEKAIVIRDHNNGSLQHPDRLTILAVSLSAHESPHRHKTTGAQPEAGRFNQFRSAWRAGSALWAQSTGNGETHLPSSIAPK